MAPLRLLARFGRFWARHPVFLVVCVTLGVGGFTFGSMQALAWMETEDFCSRCHTMTPQAQAHEVSSHSKVECAECHVGPGIKGLVVAKIGGMRQTAQLILGDYSRPIPPAADVMPAANETCGRCHDPARERKDLLLLRSHYLSDESNTEQRVALVVQLAGDPSRPNVSGIHWHVLSKVEYAAKDAQATVIDWVGVERPDGTRAEFMSQDAVKVSTQAGALAADLRNSADVKRMSCYDCHNRVGHEFPTPAKALDQAIAGDQISRDIPFIKKRALDVLTANYASADDALNAVRGLEAWYHTTYPDLWVEKGPALARTFSEVARIYSETSHPEMNAAASSYPNNLGHTDANGCFRCHDGGHYLVKDGRLTTEAIPSQCSLCHTFPTAGANTPDLAIGKVPATHSNKLWVFNHGPSTKALDPAGTTCAACHSQSYCTNCHSSGAVAIKHDDMLFDHAAVIRKNTDQPCAYCHQKPFCERCHVAGSSSPAAVNLAK